MKKLLLAPALLFMLASSHKNFDSFKQEYINKLWATYPAWATSQGFHKYDSVLVIPDAAERQNELAFASWIDNELAKYWLSTRTKAHSPLSKPTCPTR